MKSTFSIILFLIICTTSIFASDENEDLLFSPKGIAEVHITLPEGMNINSIQRDVDTKAHLEIKNSSTSLYEASELYSGSIFIEGRGNTSWGTSKKPYNIDLITENEKDNPSSLLGMPAHHKWCLISYYSDKSLMRIPFAYYLGQQMSGLPYTARLHYVELYVNGEYRGLYSLCEKIERDRNRVNINSNGYILEITPNDRVEQDQKYFKIKYCSYSRFTFVYPKNKNVTNKQVDWIQNYIHEFEDVLYGKNFKDEQNGFRKYIHEESFIDWYIVNEFAKNNDAGMFSSVFFHKDSDGKLFMSSPWDFDIAFGNIDYSNCSFEEGFHIKNHPWWKRLFEDEKFTQKVQKRYNELMPLFNKIPAILNANKKQLEETGCVKRNFEKWNILGKYVWPNYPPFPETYEGEIQRLIEWTESRKNWLYINFPSSILLPDASETDMNCPDCPIRIIDLNGRIIQSDLSNLENGIYIIQYINDSKIINKKIIISH